MIRATLMALTLSAAPALAQDVALVIGNNDYDHARDLRGADDVADTAREFRDAGFRVFSGEDVDARAMRRLASDFAAAADGTGRIAIALAGHFAQSESGAWFLATDADTPDLIGAGATGLPLNVLLEIAARAPDRAVVLLGTEDRAITLGHGLTRGSESVKARPGVAVIRGEAGEIADFIEDDLLQPGRRIATALRGTALLLDGRLGDNRPFVPAASSDTAPPSPSPDERQAWASALAADTREAYEAFLRAHPDSLNAPYARNAIERLRSESDPLALARDTEAALALSRDQRREIQRNLSLLGHDPRGIDGIFGPATRTAIGGWQRANGYQPTTFLDRTQRERLSDQAARRAAELEAEAARRQAEADRADRAYWQETGARGDEQGLRNYLRRYPDGLYAEIAEERLAPYEERRREEAAAADRDAWERATERDSADAYRRYLDEQPEGRFRDRAQERIAALTDRQDDRAARTEQALGLNVITRRLVEERLNAMGFQPGAVDGTFDDRSRRAIRRFQSQRNVPATGYLDQQTIVQILALTILGDR